MTIRVEMLKTCFVGNGIHAAAGDVIDLDDASYLIAKGFAREVEKPRPGRPKGSKNKATEETNEPAPAPVPEVKPPAKVAPPVVVKVSFAELKKKAKALGVPIKGTREEIENAVAMAEKKK